MWERFQDWQGGVLVVGHGTRVASGAAQLLELASQLQACFPKIPTEAGFLELAEPTLRQAMIGLRSRGVRRLLVIPILLFEAGHARSDIPEAVQQAADAEGITVLAQSPPLGTAAAVLQLSEFRFMQALRCRNPSGCLMAGGCDRTVECFASKLDPDQPSRSSSPAADSKIGLALVGRGTSDLTALEHMQRFSALRIAASKTPLAWTATGFFAGGEPTLDQLLTIAAASDCDTLVIQPHLLFEGQLVRQLREKVHDYQQNSPRMRWLVTPTLGADPQLAGAFFSLASETLGRLWPANSPSTRVATVGFNS